MVQGVVLDWDEIADLVDDSYRMTAPKRLSRLLDDGAGRGDRPPTASG